MAECTGAAPAGSLPAHLTLAILTEAGWDKVVATAPGHVEEVRRLVLDPLTQAQQRTLRAIGQRVNQAVDPTGAYRLD
ncbi:hypothetical protein [Kitasatospora sp. NPDC001683]